MSHVATAPHECAGNLIFVDHGLSPYWTLGKLLMDRFDGYSDELEAMIDGEQWTIELSYQQSGIAPRFEDDVTSNRLYEYRVGANGRGERKATFLIQPRFENMRHYETADCIQGNPFDHVKADEGVNVRFSGSNLEPDEYRHLLPRFVQELASAGGLPISLDYFASDVHEMSNITTYERYVRIRRSMSSKVVERTGIMRRLFDLCATERGSKAEYRVNNEDIIGYNHRVVLPKQDAKRLVSGHQYGKQVKHYHPKHVRKKDDTDPLYHPKVGVLLKKQLTGHSFDWADRRDLRREIDEALINLLYWSDVSIRADQTTYIPDDHFEACTAERTVGLEQDPTPEIEAQQESLLVTTLRDMCDSDEAVLESLVTDGGQQHPHELAENTGNSISTIYRALDRLRGIVRNETASVGFASRKFEQEIAGIVDSTEHQIENAADRVAKILNMDVRQAASSAWQKWCNEYAAKVMNTTNGDKLTIRIDTMLSELKSTSQPYLPVVLREALSAWNDVGRDVLELRQAQVKWRDPSGNWRESRVPVLLR